MVAQLSLWLRPRQEAVNLFIAAFHEGRKADRPHKQFLAPKLREAPRAPQDLAHRRAYEAQRARQKRDGVRTPLATRDLRFIIADAWGKVGTRRGSAEA